jgi:3-(3-hydroxy-phenyl)propionate hydroxylase
LRDLIIVGCGPVGAVAGNLAGAAGLSASIFERATDVFKLPRAIHFDAHIMRILQQAQIARDILPETRVWKRSTFYGADGQPIRVHEWPDDQLYGWDAHYLFYQPALERLLRAGLNRHQAVQVHLGTEVGAVKQYADHVTVTTREVATGRYSEVSGRHLIAADGASSFIRDNTGIRLLDNGFDEPWLVIDLLCERELGRPNESEMFCDPRRPSTRVPGPGRHHRWEFMLLPGEKPEHMQQPDVIRALLQPWVSLDEVEILRASVYRFHSLIAERWRDGRVFLAGDAAHQTPPFLGQGLCHGIRDVQNLIWKIAAATRGGRAELLRESYEAERRPHVTRIINMAVNAGREICMLDPAAAAERDQRLRRAALTGELPRTTFQGLPPLEDGLFSGTTAAGELFPQPTIRSGRGHVALFDDLVPPDVAVVAINYAAPAISSAAAELDVPVVAAGEMPAKYGTGLMATSDQLAKWFEERGGCFAVLRPDRYVFGVTSEADEAEAMLRELCASGRPLRRRRPPPAAPDTSAGPAR